MPVYEYFCPTCKAKFERLRSITVAQEPATCTNGHTGTRRLVSLVAPSSRAGAEQMAAPAAGGCCGGSGCACGH